MTKSNKPSKGKSIDITLRDLAVPKKVPWSAFVLLIILYVITSFLTSKCATTPGSVQFLDKVIPYNAFAGVFTSLSNLCVMFLVLLFRKPGYIVSMIFAGFVALGAPTTINNIVTGIVLLVIVALTTKRVKGAVVK